MKRRCPCCGSNRIIVDPLSGNLVCQDCGCVIEEGLIDDYNPGKKGEEERYPPKRRVLGKPLPSGGTTSWGMRRIGPTKVLGGDPPDNVKRIADSLPRVISVRSRTKLALAYYIYERSEGNSKTRAIAVASEKTGLSKRSLERIIRRYRPWIEGEIRRVATGWRTASGTRRA